LFVFSLECGITRETITSVSAAAFMVSLGTQSHIFEMSHVGRGLSAGCPHFPGFLLWLEEGGGQIANATIFQDLPNTLCGAAFPWAKEFLENCKEFPHRSAGLD
jgi:hypothetical protein